MSAIRFRVFAAIAGALLGLGAFVLVCQALTVVMIAWLGTVGGLMAAAAILALFAFIAFWVVSRPNPEMAEELDDAKSAATDMLAGIPGDALLSLIRNHPVTAILAAAMMGYSLIRDPGRVMRQLQTLVVGLL